MKHTILLATVVAITAAMLAVSSLSSAQVEGQYTSGAQYVPAQYAPTTTTPAAVQTTLICAPWAKEWDISQGQWQYDRYRWCVDTSLYDPSVESSWYREWGEKGQGDQVNLCPESGTCTVNPGGGVKMTTTSP